MMSVNAFQSICITLKGLGKNSDMFLNSFKKKKGDNSRLCFLHFPQKSINPREYNYPLMNLSLKAVKFKKILMEVVSDEELVVKDSVEPPDRAEALSSRHLISKVLITSIKRTDSV
ncbi:hypothetical protein NPIL_263771 [Nephila pilipes]|uniref:Uncharacterized protein n=1 Tax=Nephila pilipes TaxID=299642 RepID=A0A8X6QNU6_NEPPI|nr:hypothetical protein NPIL_263771 [Nephila pilipes]